MARSLAAPQPLDRDHQRTGTLDPAVLEEIVRRIVEVAAPERIILFGSAARGEMGPDSDVDLLVIVGAAANENTRAVTRAIYGRLLGITLPVDVVVARQETITQYQSAPALIYLAALHQGQTVYAG